MSIIYVRPREGYHPSRDGIAERVYEGHIRKDYHHQKNWDAREEEDWPLEVRASDPRHPDHDRMHYTGCFDD